jgi:hypothetical protein
MPQPQDASVVDFAAAKDVTPESAPVGRALSGKERAGVNLTWGVLGLIGLFLSVIILILWANESQNSSLAAKLIEAGKDAAALQSVAEQRAAFRTFWLEITRTILLNVLLPVLTALLGYVFGTTQVAARTHG